MRGDLLDLHQLEAGLAEIAAALSHRLEGNVLQHFRIGLVPGNTQALTARFEPSGALSANRWLAALHVRDV